MYILLLDSPPSITKKTVTFIILITISCDSSFILSHNIATVKFNNDNIMLFLKYGF